MPVLDALVAALRLSTIEVIDLTAPLHAQTPVIRLPEPFGNTAPFALHEISRYDERGPAWYWNDISTGEHTGTHFDAPIHWVTGKDYPANATDTIAAKRLIAPACVIDVSEEVKTNADFFLTREHIEAWEGKHGRLPAGSWVLMRTDWSKRRGPASYLNVKKDGGHTPGPHPELIPFLAKERNVIGFGAETVGTDAGQASTFDPPFPCHNIMHGSNKFGLASLTNLDQLPPTGSILIAAPLKIVNGSGSPCRVLALVPV